MCRPDDYRHDAEPLSVGRIIHVRYDSSLDCQAAIVTGPKSATVFAPTGPATEAARRIVVNDPTLWHWPRECPNP